MADKYTIEGLHELFTDFKMESKSDLNEIKEQTKLTNGRVSKLEKWMWGVVGGGSVLILLPTIQEVLTNLTN